MSALLFVFPWLADKAGTSEFWLQVVAYLAWLFDSYATTVLVLLLIIGLSGLPKENVALYPAAVLYTALVFLHFDAAHWRSNLPATTPTIIASTLSTVLIPWLSFVLTRLAWKARHSK